MKGYTPMMRQYLQIKAEHEDCLLFFRLGDFYEMFFQDAETASQVLEITLTSRDGGQENRIPMCGVPYHSADTYIARLLQRGYKIAICEQTEDPAQAKGVVRREVVQILTPGTVLSGSLLQDNRNNFLVMVATNRSHYGLAATDVSTGEFFYTSLPTIPAVLDEMIAYDPSEILLDPSVKDRPLMHDIVERFHVPISVMHREDVLTPDEARSRLTAQFSNVQPILDDELAVRTNAVLLHYLQQTQKRSLKHVQVLTVYEASQYMTLDRYARRNLELTETIRGKSRKGSLLWLLDHTATAMGSRLLKKWLDKPLLDRELIEQRLSAVETLVTDMVLTQDLHDLLKEVYDLERLAGRIAFGTANARDLISLKRSLDTLPALWEIGSRIPEADKGTRQHELDLCQDIANKIGTALADDPPVSVKEGGLIRSGYNAELDKLTSAKREGKDWIAQLQQDEREKTGIKSLKVGYNRVFGYYLEVTKANLHLLPEGRYQRKQTLTNAERFVTPELKEKETLILEAEERSVSLEYELFVQLRDELGRQVDKLQQLAEWVATVDALHSLAMISARHQYVRPRISRDAAQLVIEAGRHPVVESVLEDEPFTPNDTRMDTERQQILLITGPNMAGKSTYMRQVALIVIMAHIGCFVPAKAAAIPLVDRIFTRIGAADDLVGGQSTFMVEMLETQHAIMQATERSLILLDEIGRGTSTYDGMAIAHALIEYIHDDVGAKTLFSSHYHELTQLADTLPRAMNVHARCEERQGNLLFLHRIEPGRADRSYGIHVAELAGMPTEVIQRAQTVLTELEAGRGESAASEQLSFSISEPERDPKEEDVLHDLLNWDLHNQTPVDTVQFVHTLQKRLREG